MTTVKVRKAWINYGKVGRRVLMMGKVCWYEGVQGAQFSRFCEHISSMALLSHINTLHLIPGFKMTKNS